MSVDELIQAAAELSEDERVELAGRLLDGVQMRPDIEDAWRAEVERRWSEIESGEVETVPASTALARIRQRVIEERQASSTRHG